MKESSGGVGVEEKGHHTIQKMTCETEVPKIMWVVMKDMLVHPLRTNCKSGNIHCKYLLHVVAV